MTHTHDHKAVMADRILADPDPGRALHAAMIAAQEAGDDAETDFFAGLALAIEVQAFGPADQATRH